MQFVLHDVLNIGASDIPGYDDLDRDTTGAILEEAAKLAEGALAPVNATGDREGCRLENGVVRTPTGFAEAFAQIKDGGWNGLDLPEEYGGQNLPYVMNSATGEFFVSANMALNMYQGLTHGAISAILAHGSDAQKAQYLPKLVSLDWTGTMNLTEPHCGTDLGLIRTKAEPQEDGSYAITRAKDFHLGRRTRHGREHHPSGAGQGTGRGRGDQGHLAVHRAEIPCQRGWQLGRAQWRQRRQY